jgi:hypothetical protein
MFECFWRGYDQIRPSAIVSAGFMLEDRLCVADCLVLIHSLAVYSCQAATLVVSSADIRLLRFGVLHLIRSKAAIVIRKACESSLATIPLFPQPTAEDKSNAQSHKHRLGWVLLNICSYFRLPRLRARLGIRPCIFYDLLEVHGFCFRC